MSQTIYALLRASVLRSPSAPALFGISPTNFTYNDLIGQIERTIEALNSFGIGRGDRVALALSNGPEAAACCLAAVSTATSAPLNPASTAAEFESYLLGLKPQALIVDDPGRSRAAGVAERLRIPVIRLIPDLQGPAGTFQLHGRSIKQPAHAGLAEPGDIALLVHTSGSTARPKIAPLTHRNVCRGAMNNVVQLALGPQDRCLCITGLFYTQGILVSVLSSLLAGGSAVCTPGYDPAQFFEWLDEFRPTWYAAPVSMHRSILARAARHSAIVSRSRLRVIRCTSSPASADFTAKMEELFRAPVLNTYGLSETSSTIAGELLPPAPRKTGSVGVAVGCEIAAIDEHGSILGPDQEGELIVRGAGVLSAYEGEPEVNRKSFIGGWLRTGDLGRIDRDGYVFLTGRIKEIINRGGEKISPAEIDEVLNAHPAVAEAITFALPDEALGEEVAAALMLRDGWEGSRQLEAELRNFCSVRLASSKMPRRIVFVDEIPKAPTGKALRIGLAERLGLNESVSGKPSATATGPAAFPTRENGHPREGAVAMLLLHIWEDILGRSPIGLDDEFFDLGGDSLLGAQLLARVEETFGKRLTVAGIFEAPTVARMASLLSAASSQGHVFEASKIIAIRSSGELPPLFIVGPHPLFRPLILRLPRHLPVFGMTFPDPASLATPFRIEEVAAKQVEALCRFQREGPYALMGWCADGVLAYEMGRQLLAQGQSVSLVAMVDASNPARYQGRWNTRWARAQFHFTRLSRLDFKDAVASCLGRLETLAQKTRRMVWRAVYRMHLAADRRVGDRLRVAEQILPAALRHYVPPPYDGRVLVFRAGTRPPGTHADAAYGWQELAADLRVVDVPGNHRDMFVAPNVQTMAQAFAEELSAPRHRFRSGDAKIAAPGTA